MSGFLRNSVRLPYKALSLPRPVHLFSEPESASGTHLTCQKCYAGKNEHPVTPNFLQISTRFFGTLRCVVGSNALSLGGNRIVSGSSVLSEVNKHDSWTMVSGGPYLIQTRGMKYKGIVKRRCKDCYLQWINGMLYNLCKTHPRHKHGLKQPYYANQRILTEARRSVRRGW